MAAPSVGNLLIVDDEPSVRRALIRLLRREGYVIHSASDAVAADQILDSDPVDVIICDQDMPGTTGIEFLMEAAKRYPHQRRLMISGRFRSDEVAHAMDIGVIHKFMMKPWDDAILKADIRASFRRVIADFSSNQHEGGQRGYPDAIDDVSWMNLHEDRRLSQELHLAAGDGSLSLRYQPQVDLRTGSVRGLEALLRWEASIGWVSPTRFIGLAERGGAMSKLTHWVVCEVCHRLQHWLPKWSEVCIGLNVSPVDLHDDALIDYLEEMLARTNTPPFALQIEITESQAVNSEKKMTAKLERLSSLGVGLAIDDFGAGATTLSYLTDLPVKVLKLDRSLTQQLTDKKGGAVVQKVLEMARSLGMKTTVEGIETPEQAEIARALGADLGQGFYFSKPKSQRDIQDWIVGGRTKIPT